MIFTRSLCDFFSFFIIDLAHYRRVLVQGEQSNKLKDEGIHTRMDKDDPEWELQKHRAERRVFVCHILHVWLLKLMSSN